MYHTEHLPRILRTSQILFSGYIPELLHCNSEQDK